MATHGPAARGERSRPATIYTVAERAGVSHQTVSRYLRGETLRPDNRERVEQAMNALDYQVNEMAQALATKKSHRIGAFVFDLDDWAPQRILAGNPLARPSLHPADSNRAHPLPQRRQGRVTGLPTRGGGSGRSRSLSSEKRGCRQRLAQAS